MEMWSTFMGGCQSGFINWWSFKRIPFSSFTFHFPLGRDTKDKQQDTTYDFFQKNQKNDVHLCFTTCRDKADRTVEATIHLQKLNIPDCQRMDNNIHQNIYRQQHSINRLHIISYHIISYHIISYHIISYHSNPLRATCEAWNTLKRLDHTHARPHNLSWARLLRLIPPAVVSKPLGNTEMVERWLGLSPCPGCNRHHQDDIMFVGSGIPKYKL